MSGGLYDYRNDQLMDDIFGFSTDSSHAASRVNPLDDKIISEIVYDVFDLLHEFDWYRCGDTGPDTYQSKVIEFKRKWLQASAKELVTRCVDSAIADLREELMKSLSFDARGDP